MKKTLQKMLLASAIGCLVGCMSDSKTGSTFNPDAVYRVPAAGLWTLDLLDDATGKKQGLMYVMPGTFLIYEGAEIQ